MSIKQKNDRQNVIEHAKRGAETEGIRTYIVRLLEVGC